MFHFDCNCLRTFSAHCMKIALLYQGRTTLGNSLPVSQSTASSRPSPVRALVELQVGHTYTRQCMQSNNVILYTADEYFPYYTL